MYLLYHLIAQTSLLSTLIHSKGPENWVRINPLPRCINEIHIVGLVEATGLWLQNTESAIIFTRTLSESNQKRRCWVRLKSEKEAAKFAKRWNGKYRSFSGKRVQLDVMQTHRTHKELKKIENRFKPSKWLKISNLPDSLSKHLLTRHLQKEFHLQILSVDLRRHQTNLPSFAYVQFGKIKIAQKAMEKLQLKTLRGQRMWVTPASLSDVAITTNCPPGPPPKEGRLNKRKAAIKGINKSKGKKLEADQMEALKKMSKLTLSEQTTKSKITKKRKSRLSKKEKMKLNKKKKWEKIKFMWW